MQVAIHDDHFAPDALDEDWLREAGQRSWVVRTKDRGIRYRGPALAAIRLSAVRMFVLTAGDLQGPEMAAIFVRALPRILRVARGQPAPFIAKVTKSGVVSVLVSSRQFR